MKNILIIEDDKALSNGISFALGGEEIAIEQCFDIKTAKQCLAKNTYHLIVLDVNLPDGCGLDFMKEVKEESMIPIILLTANDLETDIVMGLEMGADDYITKPFSLAVLRARVKTQLRRQEREQICGEIVGTTYIQDDISLNFERMEFFKGEEKIDLSITEQKLLRILITNRGITLTRSQLIDYVWTNEAEYVNENALSVSVKRLRDKLETDSVNPRYIKTVYGVGYMWEAK